MSEEFDRGRREGLRLALAILGAEEEKWAALIGKSSSWRTNAAREVRFKTLGVAQRRLRTALSRLMPRSAEQASREIAREIGKIGL